VGSEATHAIDSVKTGETGKPLEDVEIINVDVLTLYID